MDDVPMARAAAISGGHGYDCSGLVVAAYASVGMSLPRTTDAMLTSHAWRHGVVLVWAELAGPASVRRRAAAPQAPEGI